jgi:hypothetical protein
MHNQAPSTPRGARRAVLALAVAVGLALGLASPAVAAFPGNNGLIAFARDGQIWTQTPGVPTSQLQRTSMGDTGDPVWSPDGTRIAFSSDRGGGLRKIFIQGIPGSEPVNPTATGPADLTFPAWSPDGTRIAYQQGSDDDADIVVVTLLGNIGLNPVTVAGGPGEQAVPTWSADGSRIFFSSGDDTFVVNANGTGRGLFAADARRPDVSPDGSRVVVVRSSQVVLLNGDGSGNTQLTLNSGGSPAFSPDGGKIVFNQLRPMTGLDLFTVGAAAGASIDQETFSSGNDFGPDWQPIGPAPIINQLSGSLVAGSAGATLVVDGAGFVRRSVVRWNGTDRATSFVNSGRLTAVLSAADVAAVGTGQVTVFTSPLGGGLSAPKTAGISAPPPPPGPRILVASSSASVKGSKCRIRGKLLVKGTLERAGTIEIALLRGRVVVRKRTVKLPAGAFSTQLVLRGKLAPGDLKLRLREVGGGGLVAAERSITIPAPPEGVASQAIVSSTKGGPAALTLRNKSKLFAKFTFAALPRRGRITTTWIAPSGQSKVNIRPRTRVVGAEVAGRNGSRLPSGTWRCVLKAGKRVIAVAKVRLS